MISHLFGSLSASRRLRRLGASLVPAFLAGLLMACGASSPQIAHESALPTTSELRSYALLEHPIARHEPIDDTMEALVHEHLAERGYERTSRDQADLLVSYKLLAMGAHEAIAPLDGRNNFGTEIMVDVGQQQVPDQHKVVLLLVQDRRTLRTLWLGWSLAEVPDAELAESAIGALGEILDRLPEASR